MASSCLSSCASLSIFVGMPVQPRGGLAPVKVWPGTIGVRREALSQGQGH